MTAISSWAVVICIAAVICGVLELLAPSSRMNGILRFVFGGFMLCVVIVPLSEIDLDFSAVPPIEDISSSNIEVANEQSVEYVKKSMAELVKNKLSEISVEAEEILIDMDIDEDNCINMIKVRLKISAKDLELSEKIRSKIADELGLECLINE